MSFDLLPTGTAGGGCGAGLELLGSPDLLGAAGFDAADGLFSDVTAGDVRPATGLCDFGVSHDELQLSPVLSAVDPSFFGVDDTAVPDVRSVPMPGGGAGAGEVPASVYYQQLQGLEIDTPAWVRQQAEHAAATAAFPSAAAAVPEYPPYETVADTLPPLPTATAPKTEPMSFDDAVPYVPDESTAANRPKTGPGSRRKVQEEIRDELDHVIYNLFPMDKLRLPREDFQKWQKTSGIRKLSVPEQRRLAKIRRMILARVYAERTRLRKIAESQESGQTLNKVKAENSRLRKKVAKLEAVQSKVMEQLKRLMAQQKIHVK